MTWLPPPPSPHPPAPVEQVPEAAQVGHVHDLDGPEAQRAGLLPAPVDLDEAQVQVGVGQLRHRADGPRLVHLGQVGLDPGRPHHVQGAAAAALGRRLQQEGPSEAVVGVEVGDHNHLDGLHGDAAAAQVRQCGRRGLHQDRLVHDEAVPVPAQGGEEVARPQEGPTRSPGVGQGEQRRHQDRVALHRDVGHRKAPVEHEHQVRGRGPQLRDPGRPARPRPRTRPPASSPRCRWRSA